MDSGRLSVSEFEVPLVGAHNVRNALAAIAVATEVGIDPVRIADGLREPLTEIRRRAVDRLAGASSRSIVRKARGPRLP